MSPAIRPLEAAADLARVADFWRAAPDYWLLAEGECDAQARARAFFEDAPPGCDPALSQRLGLFLGGRLSGVAELSFGYPEPGDAYLGLMVLGPWAQGAGHGRTFLAEVGRRARAAGARTLFLAVLERNPRGRTFWEREGFRPTGVGRADPLGGRIERLAKAL
ncbi:MAG: GNAT family N-acetyltransferase [Rhodobacteraceae bacterium]|nr:GNAT family N-acetyltransferase [Paracoccaceae bacterium]